MGRPPKITRDEILDAASQSTAEDLQLTSLARALGISVKTVYYYFPTRRALIDALTDRAVSHMGLPEFDRAKDWRAVLAEDARWHYRLGSSQPGWFFRTAAPRGIGIEMLRQVQARLAALGWTKRDAMMAHLVICNWAIATGEGVYRSYELGGFDVDNIRRHLDDYADPATVDALSLQMSELDLGEVFETGLDIVLNGIEESLVRAKRVSGHSS
ncbi:TetR/AcrR family transcriptional regulator [Sphingosinicella rhizophila]|nr:TetR/AcrR family transcriptional regulator [Sphingosinicella sp. GR2756]